MLSRQILVAHGCIHIQLGQCLSLNQFLNVTHHDYCWLLTTKIGISVSFHQSILTGILCSNYPRLMPIEDIGIGQIFTSLFKSRPCNNSIVCCSKIANFLTSVLVVLFYYKWKVIHSIAKQWVGVLHVIVYPAALVFMAKLLQPSD